MGKPRETTAGQAVYFDAKDYAGPIRRIIILGIDIVALVVLAITVASSLYLYQYPRTEEPKSMPPLVLLTTYLYLTVIQRSRIGTLGYLLTGVRIVDIEGRRPSLLQMTVRLIPMLPVPWSLLFDLGWMLDDPNRQTLRDKWAGTFVIRRKARPLGRTTVVYKRICFSGSQLVFPEVGHRGTCQASPAPPNPAAAGNVPGP